MKKFCLYLSLSWHSDKIARGVAHYAHQENWCMTFYPGRPYIYPAGFEFDGVIATETTQFRERMPSAFQALPAVSLSATKDNAQTAYVVMDDRAIGHTGAEYILSLGIRNVAYLNCARDNITNDRFQGFLETLQMEGLPCSEIRLDLTRGETAYGLGQGEDDLRIVAESLKALPKPLAIMANQDQQGIWLQKACQLARLSVPEDVMILAANNQELFCDYAHVPLSSIEVNMEKQGYEAARALDLLSRGSIASQQTFYIEPGEVMVRRSTELIAADNHHVARAIRFIHNHFCEPINATEVCRHVNASRAALYREFKKEIGRSIGDEILRCRMEHAKKLVVQTRLSFTKIAPQCGFQSTLSLSRSFKKTFGMTLSQSRASKKPA